MAGEIVTDFHDRAFGRDKDGNVIIAQVGKRFGAIGMPFTATATAAAGAANITNVSITVKDHTGTAVAFPVMLDVWLSDATTGAGLTATSASGTVVAGASGVDIATLTAKKALRVQTTVAGLYILQITDTAKTAFKVCVQMPDGKVVVPITLATGNYG